MAAANGEGLSALLVAGTGSGVGKTTVTLGLIAALRRRGLAVQPFKVGPDFIDPLHHAAASGRPPRNLDGWMLDPEENRRRFAASSAGADVAIVEGVMGLFDGSEAASERGSSAEMAKLLGLPVVLVVDAGAMARSAAAVVHGFAGFDPGLRLAGVVLNNLGGPGHAALLREALAGGVPVLGTLPREPELTLPERHLGLHLPHEAPPESLERLASLLEEHVDLDALVAACRRERPPAAAAPPPAPAPRARIALARDEAFCFYYADNLELLEQAGAELVPFSPLRDELPRGIDGLYLGGGYPELHAAALAENARAREGIRAFAAAGGAVYAECGGLMYLATTLEVEGRAYPGCGVLPFATALPAPLAIAYVEVTTTGGLFGSGQRARGHVFHASEIRGEPPRERCYRVRTSGGEESLEGYRVGNVLASYAHLHFASNPALAAAFVEGCAGGA